MKIIRTVKKITPLLTLTLTLMVTSIFWVQSIAAQTQTPLQSTETNPEGQSGLEGVPDVSKEVILSEDLVSEEVNTRELTEEQRKVHVRNLQAEETWKNPDSRIYSKDFALLYKFSIPYSNAKYRQAVANYQAGVDTIIRLRKEEEMFLKNSGNNSFIREKSHRHVVEREISEKEEIQRMRYKEKKEAVRYFTRAIQFLDEIKNESLREKPKFKRLLSTVYRNWVVYQFDLGNIFQSAPVLELYMQIDDNEKEYPAHKYLAQAYASQIKQYQENKAIKKAKLENIRRKKNTHLLRAAELKYGKESREYKHMVDFVAQEAAIVALPKK